MWNPGNWRTGWLEASTSRLFVPGMRGIPWYFLLLGSCCFVTSVQSDLGQDPKNVPTHSLTRPPAPAHTSAQHRSSLPALWCFQTVFTPTSLPPWPPDGPLSLSGRCPPPALPQACGTHRGEGCNQKNVEAPFSHFRGRKASICIFKALTPCRDICCIPAFVRQVRCGCREGHSEHRAVGVSVWWSLA